MKLYIVATPIGNLKDVSFRTLEILKSVDIILCEDTRQTRKLLSHYNIKTPVNSYHQHSKLKKVNYILNLLRQDKNIALVSDSGTPGISDPGNKLIQTVLKHVHGVTIVPVPGPSAVITALSICGFPADQFVFCGFPPHKKGRNKFFQKLTEYKSTIVLYESPYRILKTLNSLEVLPQLSNRHIVLARELTKKFETIYRGTIKKVLQEIEKDKLKGEFVIVIEPKK